MKEPVDRGRIRADSLGYVWPARYGFSRESHPPRSPLGLGHISASHCSRFASTAPFPADVKAPVQYGKNFRALLAYFYDAQEGASRRIREMCAEMFGYAVSEATLQAARQEQHAALETYENRLMEILPKEPVLHADETRVPINQVNPWLHVVCTPLLTFFAIHLKRGKEAIQAIGILPKFTGWLMHDFLSSYLSFEDCQHTFCKSHLLRELVFLFEQHHQTWAKDLHDLFLEMLQSVRDLKARDAPSTQRQYRCWQKQYRRILRAGRMMKVRVKISGCFRTLDGRPFLPQAAKST